MIRVILFKDLSCFEIARHECCKDVFVDIEIKGQKHTRSLRKHPAHEQIANLCSDLNQIEDIPMPVARRGRRQSGQDSANYTLPDVCVTPLDRIHVSDTESISVLSNSPSESVVFMPQITPTVRIQTRSQANKKSPPIRRSKRVR